MQTAIIEDTEWRATTTVHIVSLNPCVGFHYCGQETLHPKFKVQKHEVIYRSESKNTNYNYTYYIILVHTVVILLLVTLQKEKNIKLLEGKIREKEQELQQLQEFAKNLSTDFVRNVCPRLQRQFPGLV